MIDVVEVSVKVLLRKFMPNSDARKLMVHVYKQTRNFVLSY